MLELHLRLNDLPILNKLLDLEHRERLRNGDEERVIRDIAAGADAAPETEDEVPRVCLGDVVWRGDEAVGVEFHGVGVDGGVVGEPPGVGVEKGALGNAVAAAGVLCCAGVGETHRGDGVPAVGFHHDGHGVG